ncbi:MAG: InlB B-repeat-containing protein, partial [Kiritimatiellia bacterium]
MKKHAMWFLLVALFLVIGGGHTAYAAVLLDENFEALALGDLDGQNDWEASSVIVQTNVVKSGLQAAQITDDGYMRQVFAGGDTNVWTDLYLQPVFFDAGADPTFDPDTTVVFYFNADGHPVFFDGQIAVVTNSYTATTGEWIRVSVRSDYVAKTWDLYIDGDLIAEDLGFYNDQKESYTLFVISGAGSSAAYVDDVLIQGAVSYAVVYDGNENTGGDVPVDVNSPYPANAQVTVLGNTNALVKTGHVFAGWNTLADGEGDAYAPDDTFNITSNTTLYAQWVEEGALAVTGGNLESSGTFGGPFVPASIQYTLENAGGVDIDWSVSVTAIWLDVSETSGTLAAGASTNVTVSLNAEADTLAVDTYGDVITFANTTDGSGDTTRTVSLTVAP